MSTLAPSRLNDVSAAANFIALTADNFAILAAEIAKREPTYVSGVATTVVGAPTSGAHVLLEFWRDANRAEFICTAAGTPGTWRQTAPAFVTSDPVSPPSGYWICRTDLAYGQFQWDGLAWNAVGTVGPAGTPGSLWYDSTGAPDGATGVVGDWALDTADGTTGLGNVYEKTGASTWTLRGNIRGASGGFVGTTLYFDDDPDGVIGGYNQLLKVPDVVAAEEIDSVAVTSGTSPLILEGPYITAIGIPGETLIQAGVWQFALYADTSSTAGGSVSTILVRVYKRTTGGTETLLFETTSPALDTTAGALREWNYTAPDIVLAIDDRIVVKLYGQNTVAGSRTIRLYHNGTARYSHFHTPIAAIGPQGPAGPTGPAGPVGGQVSLSCDRTETASGKGIATGGTVGQVLKKKSATDFDTEWKDGVDVATVGRTYYVSTTGNDANDGLTVGTPFLTIQKAVDVAASVVLGAGLDIIIQLADGTYNLASRVTLPATQGVGNNIYIQGNAGNSAAVTVQSSGSTGQLFAGFVAQSSWWFIRNMTLTSAHNATLIRAAYGCRIQFSGIVFGASGAAAHIYANFGGFIVAGGDYSMNASGGAYHWFADTQGIISVSSRTITITGTPNFTTAFCAATSGGAVTPSSNTYSGSATGKRYDAALNGVINTLGAGATALPGNAAGTTATGGQYA